MARRVCVILFFGYYKRMHLAFFLWAIWAALNSAVNIAPRYHACKERYTTNRGHDVTRDTCLSRRQYDMTTGQETRWALVTCAVTVTSGQQALTMVVDPKMGVRNVSVIPENTIRRNNDVLMLGKRRRRWFNIKTSLFQCVVFAGVFIHRSMQTRRFDQMLF